ncbi:MAG: glycoside hydrolase family 28 protein, partial [Bacteroidales bacterium]|jgi:hypothetical protein|nr:glycoside hydrolase family 28 protein [Bacteroidales bacterium]
VDIPHDPVIPEVTEKTPVFRNIYVKNIISRNARRAMYFNGLPEMNISNITVRDAVITSKIGAELSESKEIFFENVTIIPQEGPALLLNNVKNMKVIDFFTPDLSTIVKMTGTRNVDIQLPASMKKEKMERE